MISDRDWGMDKQNSGKSAGKNSKSSPPSDRKEEKVPQATPPVEK